MQAHSVSSTIGHTPLVKIRENLYAKLESVNPSGSIKDRMALYILDRAEERGALKAGGTIIEATSGNSGISFAMLAAERGYRMIAVMPSDMSEERKLMMRAFGAKIIEVGPGDFTSAVVERDALAKKRGYFTPDQFRNPDNALAHEMTTGPEILEQVSALPDTPPITAFVAGTGTGGTLMGVRSALKRKYPNVEILAVEPEESQVMLGKKAQPHLIQGIGDGFVPPIVDLSLVDEIISVPSELAIERMKRLSKEQGFLVGISSGANVVAAERYIEKHAPEGIVVTVLPDRQERYFSLI